MIATKTFPAPAAVAAFFNHPDNAGLRLVSVLPPSDSPDYTALYETPEPPTLDLEKERLRLLDERIMALWQLDNARKRGFNFPESILDEDLIPLSILNNRLGQLAAFKGLATPERAWWIRENLANVACTLVSADEAREKHGCAAELIQIEECATN